MLAHGRFSGCPSRDGKTVGMTTENVVPGCFAGKTDRNVDYGIKTDRFHGALLLLCLGSEI